MVMRTTVPVGHVQPMWSVCDLAVSVGQLDEKSVEPGWLSTETRPPWATTMALTMERPSPAPPEARVRLLSARENRSKTFP